MDDVWTGLKAFLGSHYPTLLLISQLQLCGEDEDGVKEQLKELGEKHELFQYLAEVVRMAEEANR